MEGTIGEIRMFGGPFAPRNWALCDGQLIAISSNSALFSIIGTIYGGDGHSTFKLPDLRGVAPLHAGAGAGLSPRPLGQRGGAETNTLTVQQLPSHGHQAVVHCNSAAGNSGAPTGQFPAASDPVSRTDATPKNHVYASTTDAQMNAGTTTIGNTGGGQSINNMQPFQVVNYIICLVGLYPSRS